MPSPMMDESTLFVGQSGWFSSSVDPAAEDVWEKGGGQFDDVDNALYIFSDDPTADDTIKLFQSSEFKNEELAIFRSNFIFDIFDAPDKRTVAKIKNSIGTYLCLPERPELVKPNKRARKSKKEQVKMVATSLKAVVDAGYSEDLDEYLTTDDFADYETFTVFVPNSNGCVVIQK